MNLVPNERGGERVLTTQQLAEQYETSTKDIRDNFNSHKERYQAGVHYFVIRHSEQGCDEFRNNQDATQPVYLWTEKGAMYHAKSLNTDRAWETYDRLVNAYYRVTQAQSIENPVIKFLA